MTDQVNIKKPTAVAFASLIIMAAVFVIHSLYAFPKYMIALAVLFVLYTAVLYLISRKINPSDTALNNISILHITAFTIFLAFTSFDLTVLLGIVVAVTIIFFIVKTFSLRDFGKILFMFFIVVITATTMVLPSVAISQGQGTVLSDNWWNAFQWIKANTSECAVVATYWDPGHFITGIARRPVVFDGASQNAVWSTIVDANLTYEQMRDIAVTDKFVTSNVTTDGQQKVMIETARIQDIAISLSTDNETLAIKILEKYRKPGCNEMYYLATSDLIGKSYWWTYFGTWNPVDKGCATPMSQLGLVQPKPSRDGSLTFVYQGGLPSGCNQQVGGQVIVVQQNTTINAFVLDNNQLLPVEEFMYFTDSGAVLKTQENAPKKGLVILDPGRGAVIFVPPEIKDSMFTKMFFFNGQGLQHFELVNNWGGEVKLYRIRFS